MALDSPLLSKFLDDVAAGELQLPDFQRDWQWDDERIRSLLATLTLGYPMGVVMTLEAGGEGPRFKARPLAGSSPSEDAEADHLLLDGQQRLTSLFQALVSGEPVTTTDQRNNQVRRWYCIDIERAIAGEGERDEAIVSVPHDRVLRQDFGRGVRLDLATLERECEAGMFPLRLVFDNNATLGWMWEYAHNRERRETWKAFHTEVLNRVTTYGLPVIKLSKETPKEAVCTVFEKVNRGGVPLDVFELVTATYAGDRTYYEKHGHDFELRERWKEIHDELTDAYPLLDDVQNTDFLQAVCLVATYDRRRQHVQGGDAHNAPAVSCKRAAILKLPLQDFLTWAPQVVDALRWAGRFLIRQCIFRKQDVPYRTQLVPLAAIRVVLGDRVEEPDVEEKLRQWFWRGVLGEMYGGTLETRFARDLEQVTAWTDGGPTPGTVVDASFQESRLETLSTRNSAAYKGVYALLLQQDCVDWYYSKGPIDHALVEDQQVDIQQVFPQAWCDKMSVGRRSRSIVNKTPLSQRAVRSISTRSPETYLKVLERESGLPEDWLDDVVATHLIEPEHLRRSNFDAFYQARAQRVLDLVEGAMGKAAVRERDIPPGGEPDHDVAGPAELRPEA